MWFVPGDSRRGGASLTLLLDTCPFCRPELKPQRPLSCGTGLWPQHCLKMLSTQ